MTVPNRIIREGILTSERVDLLGALEEVFYRRLQSVVDDHGRFHANPKLIRAACFPLRLDRVSDSDIGKWIRATEEAGLVRQYLATDGKRYLEILDFGQRIQSKSKFPDPLATEDHSDPPLTTVNHRLVVGEDGDEDVISSASADRIPYDGIVAAYHEALPMLPVVRKLTDQRRRKLRRCWQDDQERQSLDYWKRFFAYVGTSDFLTGRSGRFTACDFEWLVEPSRHLKVSEGKYENREAA
jgi:hypothetical protein